MPKTEFQLKTRSGFTLKEVASALQKCLRRGHREEAMWFAVELVQSGYIKYLHYRLSVITHEDLGHSNTQIFNSVASSLSLWGQIIAQKKERHDYKSILGSIILQICESPKSRLADNFANIVIEKKKAGWKLEIPDYALDSHVPDSGEFRGSRFWVQVASKVLPEVSNESYGYDVYKNQAENLWLSQASPEEPNWSETNASNYQSEVKLSE